jgi:hypothetical protein
MMNASFLWDHLDMYCYAEFDLTRPDSTLSFSFC